MPAYKFLPFNSLDKQLIKQLFKQTKTNRVFLSTGESSFDSTQIRGRLTPYLTELVLTLLKKVESVSTLQEGGFP